MTSEGDVTESSEDAEGRRRHLRVVLSGLALTVVALALILWGIVGCVSYNEAGVECVKRGDLLINGNCIPLEK